MQELRDIVLIGAGNVATRLGIALRKGGIRILQVYSRSQESAHRLASLLQTGHTTSLKEIVTEASLYIIAVADDAIESVVKGMEAQQKFLVHTSGSVDMDVLAPWAQNFGVLYPLQTFSRNRNVDFNTIPVCIEANSLVNLDLLSRLASSISGDVRTVPSAQRRMLHLAAVFACNFPNYMYTVAESIVHRANLDFDLLKPLILETALKVQTISPEKAQTGPALRGDARILEGQMELLKAYPEILELYKKISGEISKLNT